MVLVNPRVYRVHYLAMGSGLNTASMNFEPRKEISRETFKEWVYGCLFNEEAYLCSKGLPIKNEDDDGAYREIELPPDHGYNEQFINVRYLLVWNMFQEIDFDVDRFFMEKVYDRINEFEDWLGTNFALDICSSFIYPMSSFGEDLLAGEIDLINERDNSPINDSDFIQRLYFCRTDEELWDLMIESKVKPTEIRQMYQMLMGTAIPSEEQIRFATEPDKERSRKLLEFFVRKGILL